MDKSRADYRRKRYASLKAAGICVKCAYEDAVPGRTQCQRCTDRLKIQRIKNGADDRRQARYAERKAAGICVKCGVRPALYGIIMCEVCRAKSNGWVHNWYEKQKARMAENG